ncbi:MAG: GNAT family N-acetyltransferase [Spirochaetaceae bacterium]|nr:GNAT family N-acetyltransferase [Spirochaetaceae bacterium]
MDNYQYLLVKNYEELLNHLNNGLHKTFGNCFGTSSHYNEKEWDDFDNVKKVFEDYLRKRGIIYLCGDENKVVGFTAAVPLLTEKERYEELKNNLDEASKYWYIGDLGVHIDYRNNKIGEELLKHIFKNIPVKNVILRTRKDNERAIKWYLKQGFEYHTGVNEVTIISTTEGDERVFMKKTI